MIDQDKLQSELDQTIEKYTEYVKTLRTGRVSPTQFMSIKVSYYGSEVDIQSIANVVTDGALSVKIQPYSKDDVEAIIEGIQKANLGYNPVDEGPHVRINIPALTEEKRKETVKNLELELENQYKKRIRLIRQDFMRKIEKSEEVTEEQERVLKKQVQEKIDKANESLDQLTAKKVKEIMSID